jgi:glycosyltransferase involved in cell wall biosynthesis
MVEDAGKLPAKISHRTEGIGGKLAYVRTVARQLVGAEGADIVICGHINLLPVAVLAKWWTRSRLLLCVYGIDAWQPPRNRLARVLLRFVDDFVAISAVTRERFLSWAQLGCPGHIIPNAIHLDRYAPGPRRPDLLSRHGLAGKKVLITVGRLASSERYKGFDEVMEALPDLLRQIPNLAYLIVGEGLDRGRLEKKARTLGVTDHVIFTGYVDEAEKADY